MEIVKVRRTIFSMYPVGTLETYTMQTTEQMQANIHYSHTGIWWRDAGSPQGFGPFASVYEAIENYKWTVQMHKNNTHKSTPCPVVRVDFKTKTRVTE